MSATADFAAIAAALKVSLQAVKKRAIKESWPYTEIPHPGRAKRLFPVSTLPPDVRNALLMHRAAALPAPTLVSSTPVSSAAGALPAIERPERSAGLFIPALAAPDSGQLDVERARDRILDFVAAFAGSAARAIEHLNAHHYAGTLPGPLAWGYEHAWDKRRKDSRLNLDTLNKWKAAKKKRGRSAPLKVLPDMSVKPWYAFAVALRQRPQGSEYSWIHEQIEAQWNPAWGDVPPSYDTVYRFFTDKFSQIDQLKGRYTGSALRSHKHWSPRTNAGMAPWLEVHADGWNTHFTAPHPITGEFVTYEVWHFHDVATRFVTPPGIGLTETYEVITAGLERCVRVGGMMAVLQTDSTKVVKRSPRFTTDPWASLADRAGIHVVHPKEVGNSQANGICENFNTYLDRRSRELATYQGKGMDSLSLKRVKKLTEKMVKAVKAGDLVARDQFRREAEKMGKGRVFMSVGEAEDWINRVVDEFNDKPHRSLPKITCPATGKRRHQTPRECLQEHIDNGWLPVALEEHHLVDLFRPHVRCKVTREAISPVGNGQRYHHPEIGAWNGKEVMAAIDPMDWRAVWVKSLDGAFLFVADLVKATGYRAQSQYEIAQNKRADAQLKRLSKKAEAVRARTGTMIAAPVSSQIVLGGRVIDAEALAVIAEHPPEAPRDQQDAPEHAASDTTVRPGMASGAVSRSDRTPAENYADWLALDAAITAGQVTTEADARWHRMYPSSAQYRAEAGKRKAAA